MLLRKLANYQLSPMAEFRAHSGLSKYPIAEFNAPLFFKKTRGYASLTLS